MESEKRARFEQLFDRHCPEVRAFARRRLPPDLADDVVSDVFVVVWRRLGDVPEDALPWLLGCARKVIANHRRGASRRDALFRRLASDSPPIATDSQLDGGDLIRALARLSEPDREALMLAAWEGLSHDRAAAVVGCTPHAFSMRLHRARQRLAAALETDRPAQEVNADG